MVNHHPSFLAWDASVYYKKKSTGGATQAFLRNIWWNEWYQHIGIPTLCKWSLLAHTKNHLHQDRTGTQACTRVISARSCVVWFCRPFVWIGWNRTKMQRKYELSKKCATPDRTVWSYHAIWCPQMHCVQNMGLGTFIFILATAADHKGSAF